MTYSPETDTEKLLRVSKLPKPLALAEHLEHTMQWPLHGKAADELRRLHEQAMKDEALLRQALESMEELQYATTDKAFAMADATIDAIKERLNVPN